MNHHLQLNHVKTELLVVPANLTLHHNFSIQLGLSSITLSRSARNLGDLIDDQLNSTDHIARFALYNIRRTMSFLSENATNQLLTPNKGKRLNLSHFFVVFATHTSQPVKQRMFL